MSEIFEPKNIIVTGGCGFIGSNFVHYAAESHNDNSIADPEPFLGTELGWRPAYTDFAEGLKATIDWYVANEAWWRPAKTATEARYKARASRRRM